MNPLDELDKEFAIDFTYNSCGLAGNSLTREQVKFLLSMTDEEQEKWIEEYKNKLSSENPPQTK